MLDGRRVLSASLVRRLKSSCVDIVEPRGHRYGYGLMHRVVAGETLLFHSGSRAGHGSYLLLVPSRRFASVTLTNRSGAMLSDWNRAAARRLLDLDVPESEGNNGKPVTLLESQFRPLLGVYENPPAIRYELFNSKLVPWTPEGGQFFSKRGFMRMPVYRMGPDRFRDELITFSLTRDLRGEPRWLHAEYKTLLRAETKLRGR